MSDETDPAPESIIEAKPPWSRASVEDLAGLDFEAPIRGMNTADFSEMSRPYRAASGVDAECGPAETPAARVFEMLSALTYMHFKPDDRDEPFGPIQTLTDGNRTLIPSDFRTHVNLLAIMAEQARIPILRAFLSDVSWLLERKRGTLALAAIAAYTDAVEQTVDGQLKSRFDDKTDHFHHARECLLRALHIWPRSWLAQT
jgi:hypothetical protein